MAGLIISVITNKGGTGKTTTAVSLGEALTLEGMKTLVVDNDSQCNASSILLKKEPQASLYEVLKSDQHISPNDFIYKTDFSDRLYCIPNIPETATLGPELTKRGSEGGFNVLRDGLRHYAVSNFDITLIDNAPNMGIFVINSLHCSDFVIIPTDAGSKHSISGLIKAVQFIQDIGDDPEGNPGLKFLRLLVTKVDRRTSVSRIITDALKAQFGDTYMFHTAIPINTAIQQAELLDKTIFSYDPSSPGAKAYRELAKELISILDNEK